MQLFLYRHVDITNNNLNLDPLFDCFDSRCRQFAKSASLEENLKYPYETNVLFRSRGGAFKDFDQLTKSIKDSGQACLMDYVEPCFVEARKSNIKGTRDLLIFLSGNHDRLPHRKGVYGHCHTRSSFDVDSYTHTHVYPLKVDQPVTEYIYGQWFDGETEPLDPDKPISLEKKTQRADVIKQFLSTSKHPQIKIPFPPRDKMLVIDFNASHWFHGVEGIENNLYLVVVMNDVRSIK